MTLKFAGFTAVYEESGDEEREEKASPLPELNAGDAAEAQRTEKGTEI
jgi:DNA topoisomerase IA